MCQTLWIFPEICLSSSSKEFSVVTPLSDKKVQNSTERSVGMKRAEFSMLRLIIFLVVHFFRHIADNVVLPAFDTCHNFWFCTAKMDDFCQYFSPAIPPHQKFDRG
jgi:hypothetical protein